MHAGKKELRAEMLRQRSSLDPGEVNAKSSAVMESFLSTGKLMQHTCFLVYLPIKNEVDTRPLLQELLHQGREVYAPYCDSAQPGRMEFYRVRELGCLQPGFCNIYEPEPKQENIFQNHAPSVAVVPGVAFDESGYRLGFGQGFYDRYFSLLPGPKPLLAGFAYDFQVVQKLPADPWDIPMHFIFTETRTIEVFTQSESN
ncbi:5-formyltetrahydrofolate cyclo-ligase [Desulfonatronospira sp.]|uniref:5-formyltetrahydrofolate cyclo-ligase n=1 Tax=Desulfonatronospira sp. TaxID=1962951 RepID=UPI0025C3D358|nr:5-formyltetrahydrofolate cyclo-ligase [Desulfonatronospira sp.]